MCNLCCNLRGWTAGNSCYITCPGHDFFFFFFFDIWHFFFFVSYLQRYWILLRCNSIAPAFLQQSRTRRAANATQLTHDRVMLQLCCFLAILVNAPKPLHHVKKTHVTEIKVACMGQELSGRHRLCKTSKTWLIELVTVCLQWEI